MVQISLIGNAHTYACVDKPDFDYENVNEYCLFSDKDFYVDADGEEYELEDIDTVEVDDYIKDNYYLSEDGPHYFKKDEVEKEVKFTFFVDDDEFDPDKLKIIIVNSPIEDEWMAICDKIIYDGEEVRWLDCEDQDIIDEEMDNNFSYDEAEFYTID